MTPRRSGRRDVGHERSPPEAPADEVGARRRPRRTDQEEDPAALGPRKEDRAVGDRRRLDTSRGTNPRGHVHRPEHRRGEAREPVPGSGRRSPPSDEDHADRGEEQPAARPAVTVSARATTRARTMPRAGKTVPGCPRSRKASGATPRDGDEGHDPRAPSHRTTRSMDQERGTRARSRSTRGS
jgi:hypothetical protein